MNYEKLILKILTGLILTVSAALAAPTSPQPTAHFRCEAYTEILGGLKHSEWRSFVDLDFSKQEIIYRTEFEVYAPFHDLPDTNTTEIFRTDWNPTWSTPGFYDVTVSNGKGEFIGKMNVWGLDPHPEQGLRLVGPMGFVRFTIQSKDLKCADDNGNGCTPEQGFIKDLGHKCHLI